MRVVPERLVDLLLSQIDLDALLGIPPQSLLGSGCATSLGFSAMHEMSCRLRPNSHRSVRVTKPYGSGAGSSARLRPTSRLCLGGGPTLSQAFHG